MQPKALGSSLLLTLTTSLVHSVLKSVCGFPGIQDVALFPMATGMTLTLLLLTMKALKPAGEFVILSRIDQKTCLKCIVTAGLKPIIVDLKESDKGAVFASPLKRDLAINRLGGD